MHRPEVRLAAIDQSRRMLAHCRRRVPGIDARLGNLLSLPFFDGRFDFVVTSFALHHLSEEQRPGAWRDGAGTEAEGTDCRRRLDDGLAGGNAQDEPKAEAGPEEAYPSASGLVQWFRDHGFSTESEPPAPDGIGLVLAWRDGR
ncbi:methyltransferase domain-containing protein [Paenibacillus sp. P26]|nr:methyltransferase domain-containing protein [Paenibacillus sp. P26]